MNNMKTINNDGLNNDDWLVKIDYKKLYSSLVKGIKWLIIMPLITGIISIIYVFFIVKPTYTSETKLWLVNSSSSNQTSLRGLASQFGLSIGSQNNVVDYLSTETLPEILSSRTLCESVLNSVFDYREFDKPISLLNIFTSQQDIVNADTNEIMTRAIRRVRRILDIKQIKNTPMFLLRVKSPGPKLSAKISLVVIKNLEKLQSDFTKLELLNKKEFISERLETVQNELFQAETKLKNFREENLQINLSPTLLLQQERLQRDIEVQTQVYISLKQQFEQVKIEETHNRSFLKIVDPPDIPIHHSSPQRKRTVIFSGILGFIIGGIIAVKKNYWGK